MSVHDAEPGDVYVDKEGKLWRVMGTCHEPTVQVAEIERTVPERPVTLRGGISGLMWDGFKRIYRPEK